MVSFQGDIEDGGGMIAFSSPVSSASAFASSRCKGVSARGGIQVDVGGDNPLTLVCDAFVNCAGLTATQLARVVNVGLPPPPTPFYAKGSYYALHGRRSPFSHLVYPVPEPGTAGLGVHATVNLGGQTRFGPDVEVRGLRIAYLDFFFLVSPNCEHL